MFFYVLLLGTGAPASMSIRSSMINPKYTPNTNCHAIRVLSLKPSQTHARQTCQEPPSVPVTITERQPVLRSGGRLSKGVAAAESEAWRAKYQVETNSPRKQYCYE